MTWRGWWEALVDLIFPGVALCGFCLKEIGDDAWRGVCDNCENAVLEMSARLSACPRCGFFSAARPCPNCWDWNHDLQRIRGVVPYEGIYRETVYSLKYGGRKDLAVPLGHLMAKKAVLSGLHKSARVIIPLPLHPTREAERGYNQSALLARQVARELSIPCADVLRRIRYEKKQTGLSRQERKANLNGAFAVEQAGAVSGRSVLLVDDIVTTGATLGAAARCLLENGAAEVCGLTWAAGSDYKYLSNQAGRKVLNSE